MSELDPLYDLRARFIHRSQERVASLRALIAPSDDSRMPTSTAARTGAVPTPAQAILRLAHQLAGAAGTFGYAAVSESASALEDGVRAATQRSQSLDPKLLEPLLEALEARVAELGST